LNGVRAIAASPARVKDVGHRLGHRHRTRAHRPGKPDHFAGTLALERERHQQRGHVRRLRFAVHDARHGGGRLIGREVLVPA
jgi:hypothetical protein